MPPDPTPVLDAVKAVLHVWEHIESYDDPETAVETTLDTLRETYATYAASTAPPEPHVH